MTIFVSSDSFLYEFGYTVDFQSSSHGPNEIRKNLWIFSKTAECSLGIAECVYNNTEKNNIYIIKEIKKNNHANIRQF